MQYPICFFVPGQPATAGSKNPMQSRRTGKLYTVDSCKTKASWMLKVAAHARQSYTGEPLTGAIELRMDFLMRRPLEHYRIINGERVLRENVPYWHTCRPDRTKLLRCAEDALVGICWKDDSQVVTGPITKRWANQPGVLICVRQVDSHESNDPLINDLLRCAPDAIRKTVKTRPIGHDKDMF
jgi:Holliday junction resolvase RusA-like endonuclease